MSINRLHNLETRLQRRRRIQRVPLVRIRDRDNPIEWFSATDFKNRYHMYKETALFVLTLIESDLRRPVKRGTHIPPIIQFLTVLRFYSTGNFQLCNSDHHKLSQATVCQLVKRISICICKHRVQFVKFPTFQNASKFILEFYQIAQFPGVVGCIDCTHVPISSPGGEDAELFRNRHGQFSINCQAVCDAELNFTNIVARWYGSAHDSRIFENSSLYEELLSEQSPGMLLGDAGYTLFPFLMTPFQRPNNVAEIRFNKAQISTRNTVERAFGILKRKFPCLKMMRLKKETTMTVIIATVVLHNITRQRKDLFLNDDWERVEIEIGMIDATLSEVLDTGFGPGPPPVFRTSLLYVPI